MTPAQLLAAPARARLILVGLGPIREHRQKTGQHSPFDGERLAHELLETRAAVSSSDTWPPLATVRLEYELLVEKLDDVINERHNAIRASWVPGRLPRQPETARTIRVDVAVSTAREARCGINRNGFDVRILSWQLDPDLNRRCDPGRRPNDDLAHESMAGTCAVESQVGIGLGHEPGVSLQPSLSALRFERSSSRTVSTTPRTWHREPPRCSPSSRRRQSERIRCPRGRTSSMLRLRAPACRQ